MLRDATSQADAPQAVDAPAATADAPPACAISSGITPGLDGLDDLAKYPSSQLLSPGAVLGSDVAAIAWDTSHLYITLGSNAFLAAYVPVHVYLEAGEVLAAPTAAPGKEYGGLVPAVPFSPTHLVAARRVSDSGSGGYNGVFVAADQWQTRALALDADTLVSGDHRTLSVRAPWSALGGCPTALRLALHVVHGQAANEWKDLVPATHTPWQMPGGGFYEIDLTASPAVSGWTLR